MRNQLALAFALFAAPMVANADFILDDFSTPQIPGSTVPVAAGGETGVARSTGGVSIVDGVTLTLNDFDGAAPAPFPGGPATSEVTYDFAPSTASGGNIDPAENFVFLRDVTTTSGGTLTITFGNNSPHNNPGPTPFSSVSLAAAAPIAGADLQIDITSISDIQNTDAINFRWDADVFGGSFTTSQIDFSSVPEPTSIALATLGLVGFGVVQRRRKKKSLEATAV